MYLDLIVWRFCCWLLLIVCLCWRSTQQVHHRSIQECLHFLDSIIGQRKTSIVNCQVLYEKVTLLRFYKCYPKFEIAIEFGNVLAYRRFNICHVDSPPDQIPTNRVRDVAGECRSDGQAKIMFLVIG
uniref:Uncharacterized protein n=1 Tax=Glossina pallidipes TaxID=7398 RepID=A0A1A9Z2T8_GLOPL